MPSDLPLDELSTLFARSIAFARGILMGRKGLNSDEAMRELILLSRSNGHSLHSVSEQIIMSVGNIQRG